MFLFFLIKTIKKDIYIYREREKSYNVSLIFFNFLNIIINNKIIFFY
jgi:hypothetical protein